MRLRACAALALLAACSKDDGSPYWAFQHGDLELDADGITAQGYQIWEFYSKNWEKRFDPDTHLCSRVQIVTGTAETTLPTGCEGCIASYALQIAELETDCEQAVGTAPTFAAMTRFAVGDVPADLAAGDPHSGDSFGWYASWGEDEVTDLGYAWNEALEYGEEPGAEGWAVGERYVLWAAYAWEL